MKKDNKLSRSAACAARLLYQTLQMLASEDDRTIPFADIRSALAAGSFPAWELEPNKSGSPRWLTFLTFYASNYKRAGLIFRQKQGLWTITDTGVEALQKYDAEGLFLSVMAAAPTVRSIEGSTAGNVPTDPTDPALPPLEDFATKSSDDIFSFLRGVDPFVFQNMVAALLRAIGYFVPFVAPKGRDGGVDVIAYSDPLGAKQPILKVQVKHYAPDNPVGVEVINALLGVIAGDGSVPLVVTSGRFTDGAKVKARASNVRLIDGDEFVSLWIEYYSKMEEDDRTLMPIVPFWFIKRD